MLKGKKSQETFFLHFKRKTRYPVISLAITYHHKPLPHGIAVRKHGGTFV